MDVVERCYEYLSNGGLFNPELMDHQSVSNLVIDCRDEIERLRQQVEKALNALKEIADKESWHCCSVSRSMKGIAIAALEKIEESE